MRYELLIALCVIICTFDRAPIAVAMDIDMQAVRDRMVAERVPPIGREGDVVIAAATTLAKTLATDGRWPDVDYADRTLSGWHALNHLKNVRTMAQVVRLEPAAALQAQTGSALDWWLINDPRNPNWWHTEIGTPQLLGDIALLLDDVLSVEQRARIVAVLKRNTWEHHTGQNLVWGCSIQIVRGLLEESEATVRQAFDRMYAEVRIEPPTGEGIMPDFSFHQHGSQLYSGGYGRVFGIDVGRFISYGWGTRFQVPDSALHTYIGYLLDGQQWMIRADTVDYSVVGREIVRPTIVPSRPRGAGVGGLAKVVISLSELDVPRRDELRTFAARLIGGGPALVGNRAFWCSDYMAHHRPEFAVSVRMFSSRTINAELVIGEGKRSHHVANGCTFIYRRGDEYANIFPVWDWNKVPGTTSAAVDFSNASHPQAKTSARFVGSVSNGRFGAAVQEIEHDGLKARKFWLAFNNGFTAIGTGISSASGRNVVTTVNQCLQRGRVERGERSVQHDGLTYAFPAGTTFEFREASQMGQWSDIGTTDAPAVAHDVFSLWINHGEAPAGGGYHYNVFAGDEDDSDEVVVLSNAPDLQAVLHRKDGILGAAFWRPGRLALAADRFVEVDQPCLILIETRAGGDQITVSNPQNEPLTVNVNVDGIAHRFNLPGGPLAGSSVSR